MSPEQQTGSILFLLTSITNSSNPTANNIFRGGYNIICPIKNNIDINKIKTARINEARDLGLINCVNAYNDWNFYKDTWELTKSGKKFILDNANHKYTWSQDIDDYYANYRTQA